MQNRLSAANSQITNKIRYKHTSVVQIVSLPVLLLMLALIMPVRIATAQVLPKHPTNTSQSNPYSPAYHHSYRHGVIPTISQLHKIKSYQLAHPSSGGNNPLSYRGSIDGIGVTSGAEKVYLVFWGNQWGSPSIDSSGNLTVSNDSPGGAPHLQNMFKGLGTGGELWSGTMTQYCDGSLVPTGATSCLSSAAHVGYPTGGALAGVWYDNSGSEPNIATGNQLANEAIKAAGHFSNTTAASNRYAQYVVLSATGTNPDNYKTSSFCAWHDYNRDSALSGGAATSPYGDIAFTNMPYSLDAGVNCGQNFVNSGSAGILDGYSILEGHEYAETITDQNPRGGWVNNTFSSDENGDACAWIHPGQTGGAGNVTTANGSYAMQSTWSNDTNRCDLSHAIIRGTWSDWASLGGTWPTKNSAVGRNADKRLQIFLVGQNSRLYTTYQTHPNGGWSGWISLGGTWPTQTSAVGQNADGRLQVFLIGQDTRLYTAYQTRPNGGWNGWASLGGTWPTQTPAVGHNADGRLQLFLIGQDTRLYTAYQTHPNGGWSGWASLGGTWSAQTPAVGQNADDRLQLFLIGQDTRLYTTKQT